MLELFQKHGIEEFKNNFNHNASNLSIYEDNTLQKEVTEGYIKTGMVLTSKESNETYELSVIGDIEKEGNLDQIDLNHLIKHVVGLTAEQLEGLPAVSADLSGEGTINQIDITILIRYIVFHELYVPEISRPEAPIIEVSNENWYNDNVTVKIKENGETKEPIAKTIYKVSGATMIEETQLNEKEISLTLNNEGETKITAYSYSKEGARSAVSSKTIKIDKTKPTGTLNTNRTKESITVDVNAKDSLSGVSSITWYCQKVEN